ncbi:hypothetical protein MP638_000096 [Amoeboaphelidium occidentale]|nr:hypothetical protein MP638_000096 [Amoeboaphelidium occidentale]
MPNRGFFCHSCRNSFQLEQQPLTQREIPQCPECQSDFIESFSYGTAGAEELVNEIPPIIRQLFFPGSLNHRSTFTGTQEEATDVNDTDIPLPFTFQFPMSNATTTTAAAATAGVSFGAAPLNSTVELPEMGFLQNLFQQLSDGRFGDYVTNQQAFDDIITQTMNAAAGSSNTSFNDQRKKGLTEEEIQLLMHLIVKLEESNTATTENDLKYHQIKDGMITLLPSNGTTTTTTTSTSNEECTICQEEYKQGDIVILLNTNKTTTTTTIQQEDYGCLHFFHEDCAVNWLKMSNTCPIYIIIIDSDTPQTTTTIDLTHDTSVPFSFDVRIRNSAT